MDVKYFKPIKRTEENSIEEWLVLCLLSQIEAEPRGAGLGFGQRCHRTTHRTSMTPPAQTGSGLRRGGTEATCPADPTPAPSVSPRNLLSASGGFPAQKHPSAAAP